MRKSLIALTLTALAATVSYPALAAPSADAVLDANKDASGAWNGKAALKLDYAYSGQGMTGKLESLDDLNSGRWADSFTIGPASGGNGFDGSHAWEKDPSGAVTVQDGGDQRQLAVNESYRRANLWWRADRGGAQVVSDGEKSDGGATYDVLTVAPRGGKAFDAWFDTKSHLLARLVEAQGTQTMTTTLSDYRAVDGAEIPYKALVNNGDAKYDQVTTVTSVTFLPAQPDQAFAMPKMTVADFDISGGANETAFPFHLYNNHIYADVSVNGKGPYQFIFDTGGVNLLTPPLVAELGLKSEGQMQGNGAGSGHMDVSMTNVSSLQLGNATVKNQVFAVMALNSMSAIEGVGMPGMVGFEIFRRFVTRVDYGAGTITLIRPTAFDPKDAGVAVPFSFNGNTIEIQADYDGHPGNFTVDTGSRSSLTLSTPFVVKNALHSAAGADAVTGWGIGGPTRAFATRSGTLRIGPFAISQAVVELSTDKGGAMADPTLAGNIGAGILKRYVVTLDYEHSTMYLKPIAGHIADLDTFDRSGMWINESEGGFTVVDVTKGAPAEVAGLKVGDEIVAVDGKPAKTIHLYDLRQRLRDDAPGTVVTFSVKNGGQARDVAVTLRDLI
ncbi:MAG TPA: aspartyl protease family protein [Rhizomicrobium sp.]|nr:aspartyl protease family protein [Rhizomicrobium sp.]